MDTIEMSAEDIEEAINSITEQKDDLRKSFEILKSFSPSIVSITFQWKDIEDHLSPIEKSIKERFREFKSLDCSFLVGENSAADPPVLNVEKKQDEEEVKPRPELKALCVNMDAKGLILFLTENIKDIALIRSELGPALLSAPDPVPLVLGLLDSSVESKTTSLEEQWSFSEHCLTVLECLKRLSVEINPQSKGRAMEVAIKWKEMIINTKSCNMPMVLSFFHIVATFGLIELLEDDGVADLIVQVGRKKEFLDVWRNTALEEKIPQSVEAALKVEAIKNVGAKLHDNQIKEMGHCQSQSDQASASQHKGQKQQQTVHETEKTCTSSNNRGHFEFRSAKGVCFSCGKKGHYIKQCPLNALPLPSQDSGKDKVNAISQDESQTTTNVILETVEVPLNVVSVENACAKVHMNQSKKRSHSQTQADLESSPQHKGKNKKENVQKGEKTCTFCGRHSHLATGCHLNVTCFCCGQKGHFSNYCPLKVLPREPQENGKKRTNAISQGEALASSDPISASVDKFINMEKFLAAARVVLSSNLTDKYPVASLLTAYINKSKRDAHEMQRRGNHSLQSQNSAIGKEIGELKALIEMVVFYKLESVFPCDDLEKFIEQLEKRKNKIKLKKNQIATSKKASHCAASATATAAHSNTNQHPCLSTTAPVFPLHELEPNNHTQLGLVNLAPYAGFDGSYNFREAPSNYIHGNSSSSADYVGLGSFTDSAYYDGTSSHGSYIAGLPAAYNPSFNPAPYPWS